MKPRDLTQSAVIAAVYALLTILIAPISSGLIQCRLSEALCVLPYYTGAAVPGLFIGCALANLLTGAPLPDVVYGSLATLLAAVCTRKLRKVFPAWFAPVPSVVCNAIIVGILLVSVYGVEVPLPTACAYVGVGQAIACFGAGLPLMQLLSKHGEKLFGPERTSTPPQEDRRL